MFGKTTPNSGKAQPVESILGKGLQVRGTIRSTGSLRIDGFVEGNIHCDSDVSVGEGGSVKGDIFGSNVVIAGSVTGNVSCPGKLELLPTASLSGDIKVGTLIVTEGALFTGSIQMGEVQKQHPKDAGNLLKPAGELDTRT